MKSVKIELITDVPLSDVFEQLAHQLTPDAWLDLIKDVEDMICDLDWTKRLHAHLTKVIADNVDNQP